MSLAGLADQQKELLKQQEELTKQLEKQAQLIHKLKAVLISCTQELKNNSQEYCTVCNKKIPKGHGIGFSVPEEEWTDRSKSRPMKLIPLCQEHVAERLKQGK